MAKKTLTKSDIDKEIRKRIKSPLKLRDWLDLNMPFIMGPSITSFDPGEGRPGCLVTIKGARFAANRADNQVSVGGSNAFVVSASPTRLTVLTSRDVTSGPVKVTVGARSAVGPEDFRVLGYPSAGAGEDGPPITFIGEGAGSAGDVNPIGTVRVLIVLLRPNDLAPANPVAARNTVVTAWDNVHTFYDQASYTRTNVQYDMTTNWAELDGTKDDFLAGDNIDWGQMDRLTAQAAQAAVNEGFDLDDYAMMACVLFLDGEFIRAWGGWTRQNFSYNNGLPPGNPDRIDINITADHDINMLAIQETANWGRCAHEFGHNVVSAPTFMGDGTGTLGEDIYSSDLVDPAAASARTFDMMGSHDSHPLFSGYHMEKLGYYTAANVQQLTWDRNPFSQDFDVIAHGLSEDATAGRVHLLKIKIADGLFYYVQVRQRPGATAQIFDDSIPLDGAPNQGGVVITRVISDTLNINQQTRFITLMHPENVLQQGDFVDDPARALRISIINDSVQARPLVCRVRVEWAQTIADDPTGSFDLTVEQWDSNWQTPDIWIDRAPFGAFDNPTDPQGRPGGNGDRPRPGEINHFHARIHVSGAMGAQNVMATFYAVFPPGVGDNGNWAPIASQNIPNIAANGFADVQSNWVPVVGQHTCLKVYASQQLGEISGGNNSAQENVFDFEAPAGSPADPVLIRTAIRNPLDERRQVNISVKGVPRGWAVHFPHSWVWLDGKAEKHFDLVVVPLLDYVAYKERKGPMTSHVRVDGTLPREYHEPLPPYSQPAGSRHYPIGGVLNRVHVLKRSSIKLDEDRERSKERIIALRGAIAPAQNKQRVQVELRDPKGELRIREVKTDAQGQFAVQFDLSYEPSLDANRKNWKKTKKLIPGNYRAQAIIFAADQAAGAESNVVVVKR